MIHPNMVQEAEYFALYKTEAFRIKMNNRSPVDGSTINSDGDKLIGGVIETNIGNQTKKVRSISEMGLNLICQNCIRLEFNFQYIL